jgi:hypothetical protein
MTASVIKLSENPEKMVMCVALKAGMFSSGVFGEDARIVNGNSGGLPDRVQHENL